MKKLMMRTGGAMTIDKSARASLRLGLVVTAALLAAACATPPKDDPEALAEFERINDPLEPFNRVVFEVNLTLDGLILKPFATMYRGVMPEVGRTAVHNVLSNLREPVVFVNDVLQGELERAGTAAGRFAINSTIGILGIIDVATDFGLEQHSEDFGQTFAVWGVGEGPFLMLPLLGPSNPRDAVGLVAQIFGDPVNIALANNDLENAVLARSLLTGLDERERNLDTLDEIERTSLDFYAALRSLYRQRRADEIRNSKPTAVEPAPGISSPAAPGDRTAALPGQP